MSISFFKFMFFMKNIIRGEKMTEINPRKFYIESFLRLDTIQVKFDAFGDFVQNHGSTEQGHYRMCRQHPNIHI